MSKKQDGNFPRRFRVACRRSSHNSCVDKFPTEQPNPNEREKKSQSGNF